MRRFLLLFLVIVIVVLTLFIMGMTNNPPNNHDDQQVKAVFSVELLKAPESVVVPGDSVVAVFRINNPTLFERQISISLNSQGKDSPILTGFSLWLDNRQMIKSGDGIGAGRSRELVVFALVPSLYQGEFNLSVKFSFLPLPEESAVYGPFSIDVNPVMYESIWRSKLPEPEKPFVEILRLINESHQDRAIHINVGIQTTGDPLDISQASLSGTWVGGGKADFLRPGQTKHLIFSFTPPHNWKGGVQSVSIKIDSTIAEEDATGEFP